MSDPTEPPRSLSDARPTPSGHWSNPSTPEAPVDAGAPVLEPAPDGGTASRRTTGVDGSQPVRAGGRRSRSGRKRGGARSRTRTVIEWLAVIGGALLVALLVKTFLIQAFWIPSPSMNPALNESDRVLVNKLAAGVSDLNRGDIIVFERPNADGQGGAESGISDLIKRVVGLPGDTIEARDGVVYVNDQRLDEPYLDAGTATGDLDAFAVPEAHVFVMGDNRTNSQDSRIFGPVPDGNVIGRAFFRVYPLSDFGRL